MNSRPLLSVHVRGSIYFEEQWVTNDTCLVLPPIEGHGRGYGDAQQHIRSRRSFATSVRFRLFVRPMLSKEDVWHTGSL